MNTPLLTLIVLVHNVILLKKNKHRQTGNTTNAVAYIGIKSFTFFLLHL